jgi:hypothetical protein
MSPRGSDSDRPSAGAGEVPEALVMCGSAISVAFLAFSALMSVLPGSMSDYRLLEFVYGFALFWIAMYPTPLGLGLLVLTLLTLPQRHSWSASRTTGTSSTSRRSESDRVSQQSCRNA